MTDDQINAAISQLYGWSANYCNDLNAMHEAEDELSGNQYMVYANILGAVEGSLFGIRATARQRAEAFLRAMGKWPTDGDHLHNTTKMVGEVTK
jgi:hypothetical protein